MSPHSPICAPTAPLRFKGREQQFYAAVYRAACRVYAVALSGEALAALADAAASVAVVRERRLRKRCQRRAPALAHAQSSDLPHDSEPRAAAPD